MEDDRVLESNLANIPSKGKTTTEVDKIQNTLEYAINMMTELEQKMLEARSQVSDFISR